MLNFTTDVNRLKHFCSVYYYYYYYYYYYLINMLLIYSITNILSIIIFPNFIMFNLLQYHI